MDKHQHDETCGCAAPHPLFGLAVAAGLVAVVAVIAAALGWL